MPDPEINEPLWTIPDVARHLRVSERTIRRWVSEGRIPFRRVGAQIRFRPGEIAEWVENQNADGREPESRDTGGTPRPADEQVA